MPPPFDLLPPILRGARVTIELTFASAALALVVAMMAGIARSSKIFIVRTIAGFYVEIFRGTSVLVQMFWIYYVLPFFGIDLSAFTAGALALGLNVGAYGAEVVRGAIASIPRGQIEAAIALNMSPSRRLRSVILPQAVRLMLPPFGNLLVELLKITSLAAFITIHEMTYRANLLRTTTGQRAPEIYSLLLLVYFVFAYPLMRGIRLLERRFSRGFTAGATQ